MSVKRENPKRTYRSLLQRSIPRYLETLSNNIMQGPPRRDHALLQLDLLQAHDMTDVLDKFRVNGDESLLQLAAIFHGDVEVMSRLASLCPRLLLLQRQGEYEGQTVLHTLVSKQNVAAASAILNHPRLPEPWVLLNGKAVGSRFYATVMMGELSLSVAALTFNLEMVDMLLDKGAKLHAVNSRGDTVLHSLVRFSHHYPQKEEDVADMMRELHRRLQTPISAPSPQANPQCVWLVENKEGLTVLRLAAALAQPSLFKLVLELEGVYCQLDRHDGLFDSLLYDVTEIDPVARQRWGSTNSGVKRGRGVSPMIAQGLPSSTHREFAEVGCCPGIDTPAPSAVGSSGLRNDGVRSVSVLEIICETGRVEKAFEVLRTYVVRSIVKSKWKHYRLWFVAWAGAHLLMMTLLTAYAVYKARLVSHANQPSPSPSPASANNATTSTGSKSREKEFVDVVSAATLPLSLLMVAWEGVRVWRRQPLNLWLIHHNGLYRLELVIFALCLFVDTVWYWAAGPVNNIFLILALLVGWWFTTFFLRPWHKFSFFTVMLQKVLLGDMLRFSTIILLELLAFSVAMYIIFLATPDPLPSDFEHLGAAVMTMFKLMLGLTEVEVLAEASQPWLAVTLFVLFVLLTYILLLNALIAMMSNTCSLVAENKESQWELQRLSVVLMLESMLPCQCLKYNSGRPMHVARFDLRRKQMVQEVRYFTKVTSVQTSYTDGAAILKRKSMMQTQRFDDVHAVMTSVGGVSHIDLLASFTHQQALLSGYDPDVGDFQEEAIDAAGEHIDSYGRFRASVQGGVGKSKAYSPLPAIREQSEQDWQAARTRYQGQGHDQDHYVGQGHDIGQGRGMDQGQTQGQDLYQDRGQALGSTNYMSVRQNLLQALRAAQFAQRLQSAQRQTQTQQTDDATYAAGFPDMRRRDAEENWLSSDAAGLQLPSPQATLKSPHTPKSVRLVEAPPSSSPTPQRSSMSPKVKRRRHNSERVPQRKAKSSHSLSTKFKTLQFPPDSEEQSPRRSEELSPIRLSEEKIPGSKQSLGERSTTQVQPKLPSPDIFTISHESHQMNSEA